MIHSVANKKGTKIIKKVDKEQDVNIVEPVGFDSSVITHYAVTKESVYKKEALAETKELLVKEYGTESVTTVVAESAIDQWLFKFKDVPFPGPEKGKADFTFIDLFAGIGGFRLALQQFNGKCIFSSEWDKQAQYTYRLNFGETPFGDITKETVRKYIPKKFDILCGGFPCQPFSRAGVSARNFLGQEHGFDDQTQGNLFFEIIDIVAKHKPNILFLENVKNLKSHDKGNTFKTIERMIREQGYSFFSTVINSQTLVPQKRERTFIVAFKDQSIKFEFPKFEGEPKKLIDYLESDVPNFYTISDNLWKGHINRSKRNKERGTGFTVSLADLQKPSNTLVARYYKDGKECLVPQSGKNPRMLTPRECARLQGYPENFICHPSKTPAYKQFGNSVAVPVIKKIAEEILKYL
jgi:DNA (cytosine-5)-methyltransferase 1